MFEEHQKNNTHKLVKIKEGLALCECVMSDEDKLLAGLIEKNES